MKHLKLFESHEELFWYMSSSEYHDTVKYHRLTESFTKSEIKSIRNMISYNPNYKIKINFQYELLIYDTTITQGVLQIIKMRDEWFYICSIDYNYYGSNQYYKCDQFDAVIECMKYLQKKGRL